MTTKTLPHPSDLGPLQALVEVHYYEESLDEFACTMHTAAPCEGHRFCIPAFLLPMLIHEYGEPSEIVGRTFLVESAHERLTRKMVEFGWSNTPAGIHNPKIDVTLPDWEQAIEACIEMASDIE